MDYHILHIEDSKTDADLIKRIIQKSGLNFTYQLASDKNEVISALTLFAPNIVLCDHSLPAFNSKMAYALCKEKNPDLPFILITGAVSEEFAVEMLKMGVDDYLLKSNLQRLPSAITNVLSKKESASKMLGVQSELQKSETHLGTIFENSSVGLILLDRRGVILELNDLAKYYTKISFGHSLAKNENMLKSLSLYHKDELKKQFKTALQGKRLQYETQYPQKDGSVITFDVKLIPTINSDGTITGTCMTFEDISERKRADNEIKLLTKRLLLATQSAELGIWEWNVKTDELKWDEGMYKLYDIPATEFSSIYDGWISRLHEDDRQRVGNDIQLAVDNKQDYKSEFRIVWNDSTIHYINARGIVERDGDGNAIRMIGINRDITEQKLTEIKLQELNQNLKQQANELINSNAELEQFAFVASHDLQEPLRMIISFLSLLEKKYDNVIDDKGKKYIDFAVDGAKRMRLIILDLLEFSRVGKTDDQMEELDLNELLTETKMLLGKKIAEKCAIIIVDPLPKIEGNRTQIYQVFQNLISNALKYSVKEIPVKIHISVTESKEYWQFSIRDNGIGIEKDYFEKIFTIFQRLHTREEYTGTGMGLTITKKIIESQGGTIWVESAIGKGSIFYFTIPKKIKL